MTELDYKLIPETLNTGLSDNNFTSTDYLRGSSTSKPIYMYTDETTTVTSSRSSESHTMTQGIVSITRVVETKFIPTFNNPPADSKPQIDIWHLILACVSVFALTALMAIIAYKLTRVSRCRRNRGCAHDHEHPTGGFASNSRTKPSSAVGLCSVASVYPRVCPSGHNVVFLSEPNLGQSGTHVPLLGQSEPQLDVAFSTEGLNETSHSHNSFDSCDPYDEITALNFSQRMEPGFSSAECRPNDGDEGPVVTTGYYSSALCNRGVTPSSSCDQTSSGYTQSDECQYSSAWCNRGGTPAISCAQRYIELIEKYDDRSSSIATLCDRGVTSTATAAAAAVAAAAAATAAAAAAASAAAASAAVTSSVASVMRETRVMSRRCTAAPPGVTGVEHQQQQL